MNRKIVAYLTHRGQPVGLFDMADAMDVPPDVLEKALRDLMDQGRVVVSKKGLYALPRMLNLIAAHAMVARGGTLFARPLDGSPALKLSRSGDMRAMNGDEIYVRLISERSKDGAPLCELKAVTRRVNTRIMAVLQEGVRREAPSLGHTCKKGKRRSLYGAKQEVHYISAQPCDPHILCGIEVTDNELGAKIGEMVCLEVLEWPKKHVPLKARVVSVLGDGEDLSVQMNALIKSRKLREDFPTDVLLEAAAFKSPRISRLEGRIDRRDLTLFTIDGEDAKDFDDAVSLEKTPGGWELGVHIADVSYYVPCGGAIDREARRRGTSVYLPGRVIPMLPEILCNDLCSLRQNRSRLALSLFMQIEGDEIISSHLEQTLIRSCARLTYEAVNRLLAGEKSTVPRKLHDVLCDMDALAQRLRARRVRKGCLDFEVAEPHFTLDEQGNPLDVQARMRGEAERMIEDFMLAANETVAERARLAQLPLIYRVHEKPDAEKLTVLENLLHNMNYPVRLTQEPKSAELQEILRAVEGTKESLIVKSVMLRSLKRACYSSKPLGHYALAMRDYCHFTSPIRRYPDLVVHRMMKMLITGQAEKARSQTGRMADTALLSSRREQEVSCLERDGDDLVRTFFMKPHVGELFEGTVTGVNARGFFVRLDNTAEGIVRAGEPDDDYFFDEDRLTLTGRHSRRVIRPGDRVCVRLDGASVPAREMTFTAIWPGCAR